MNLRISLLIVLLLCGMTAQASIINFGSGDGVNENNNLGSNVIVTPHSAWGVPTAPYSWVSFANTGVGAGSISPANTTVPIDNTYGSPTAIFTELLPMGTYWVTLNIRADDTAGVWLFDASNLTGLLLKAPNPVQDGACAAGSIGCEPNENWSGAFAVNSNGAARLEFPTYQVGGGPFALSYEGTAAVPEPATYALFGGGLIILGGIRKFRARSRN